MDRRQRIPVFETDVINHEKRIGCYNSGITCLYVLMLVGVVLFVYLVYRIYNMKVHHKVEKQKITRVTRI